MANNQHPTLGHGKICYLEIPSTNVAASSMFYEAVFGWQSRTRGDGSIAFDDGVGEVSGTWTTKRPVNTSAPGLIVHIMVDDAETTIKAIIENGGTIVQPVGADHPEITAHFTDPDGNRFGIFQEGGSRKKK
jgi:uncharacterized protein